MASKIKGKSIYVDIKPYEHEGQTFNVLNVCATYRKGNGFCVYYKPGWTTDWGGYGCILMGATNPLTATTWIDVKPAPKNSQKTIDTMAAALELAKDIIGVLFDKREWQLLRNTITNVAFNGYTENFRQQAEKYIAENKTDKSETTISNNETTMAKNLQAADLIGKSIVKGNMSYNVKGAEGDTLTVESVTGDRTTAMPPMKMAQVEKLLEGGWTVSDTQTQPATVEEVEEVSAVTPTKPVAQTVTMEPATKPKKNDKKPTGPKAKTEPKTAGQGGLVYSTYTNKKGKKCAKISGLTENHPAYVNCADLHGSASYEKDKQGDKVFYLVFGPRYADAAKEVCELLNKGKALADCKVIIDQATEARAQQREEWKQQREERRTNANDNKPTGYSDKDVAEMLKKIMAGGDIPENIKAAMAA